MERLKIERVCRLIRTHGKTEWRETEAREMRTPGQKIKAGEWNEAREEGVIDRE